MASGWCALRGETEFLSTIRATPEHTWALLLALVRKLPAAAAAGRAGAWDRDAYRGTELDGKRLGIFGFGRVGRIVATFGAAFRMSVAAYDTAPSSAAGVSMVASLEELLERSDVLLVHVPLDATTEGAIGAGELARLPPGAVLGEHGSRSDRGRGGTGRRPAERAPGGRRRRRPRR